MPAGVYFCAPRRLSAGSGVPVLLALLFVMRLSAPESRRPLTERISFAGLATEMLRQGASLGEIGDVLGHRHPQTTMIYTKVDLEALRTLALPWPGGAL